MKKLMLLLLMIISIIPLAACEEPPKEEEKEEKYEHPSQYQKLEWEGYGAFNNSFKIRIEKNSFSYDEIINIYLSVELKTSYNIENMVTIEIVKDDCFQIIGNEKYEISTDNIYARPKYEVVFSLKAANASYEVKKLNFKVSFYTSDKITSEIFDLFKDGNEYSFYPYIYIIIDELGAFLASEDYIHDMDKHHEMFSKSYVHFRLNQLYEAGLIEKIEYRDRLNMFYNNSYVIFNINFLDMYYCYLSPSLYFKIKFTNEQFDVSNFTNFQTLAFEILNIAYECGYISLEELNLEVDNILKYALINNLSFGYFTEIIPFDINKIYINYDFFVETKELDFEFEYDKLPYDNEIEGK